MSKKIEARRPGSAAPRQTPIYGGGKGPSTSTAMHKTMTNMQPVTAKPSGMRSGHTIGAPRKD